MFQTKFKLSSFSFALLTVLPALVLGILIIRYGVNVPFGDQWDSPGFAIAALEQGTLSFQGLIAQHNESRLLFPRLLFLGLAQITNWNVKYEMLVSLALACFVSFNLYRLMGKTLDLKQASAILSLFLMNLLIFSPIQYENWLWGIQIVVFTPIACLTTVIILAYSRLNRWLKFIGGAMLATVSTFSYANGLLCWMGAVPVFVLDRYWNRRSRSYYLIGGWIAACVANLALYFHDYVKPDSSPTLEYGLQHPWQVIRYFFCFLGAPLGSWSRTHQVPISMGLGCLIFVLFVSLCVYIFGIDRDLKLIDRSVGWLTIAAYTLISALVTSIGRAGAGFIEQSLSSKYTTFSSYLIIALIPLTAIVFRRICDRYSFTLQRWIARGRILIATGLILLFIPIYDYSIGQMREMYFSRLQGKTCLTFINIAPDNDCLKSNVFSGFMHISKNPDLKERLFRHARLFDRLNFLQPKLIQTKSLTPFIAPRPNPEDTHGWFDGIAPVQGDRYLAWGWSLLPGTNRPSDGVILTYDSDRGEPIVFAVSHRHTNRSDVARTKQTPFGRWVGWEANFKAQDLPDRSVIIKAWAFDNRHRQAFYIGTIPPFDNSNPSLPS